MHEIPTRFRHPIDDPDPLLARQYQVLFERPIGPIVPAQAEALGRALLRADPLADAYVASTAREPAETPRRALEQALARGLAGTNGASDELRALLAALEHVPAWVDGDELERGARVFRRTGMFGLLVLADFALLGGYRSSAIAKTLIGTGRLRYAAAERLMHTGRFVLDVTQPGQLVRGRAGYVAAAKVRVVHARVRCALHAAPAGWDTRRWGLPINQADMLGTNLLFSIGFLEGCRRYGFHFREHESAAVLHLWRYVGYLLGVESELLPVDLESALRALYMVGVSQPDPDEDSIALARALREVPLEFATNELSRRLVQLEMGVRVSMSRKILGDAAIDQLGLPRSRARILTAPLVATVRAFERARSALPLGDHVAYHLGDRFVKLGQAAIEDKLARLGRSEPSRRDPHPSARRPLTPRAA